MATDVMGKIKRKEYKSVRQAIMAVNHTKFRPKDKRDLIELAEEVYSEAPATETRPVPAANGNVQWLGVAYDSPVMDLAKKVVNGILSEKGLGGSTWAEKYTQAFNELATEYRVDMTLHAARLLGKPENG